MCYKFQQIYFPFLKETPVHGMSKADNKAKMLGQFFTKQAIASLMVSLFSGNVQQKRILEPCFGKGAFLQALKESGCRQIVGCELDAELYEEVRHRFPDMELIHGDFLQYRPQTLFDGILMNPPYIRHENIDLLAPYGVTKNQIRENEEFRGLPSQANLYMYFIVHAFHLLKDGGELVVIFPKSWLNSMGGKHFSTLLNAKAKLQEKVVVRENAFERDAMVDVVIFKWTKIAAASETQGQTSSRTGAVRGESVCPFPDGVPFKRYARVRRGMSTGCNKLFVNPPVTNAEQEQNLIPILSTPKAIKGYSTRSAVFDRLLMLPPRSAPQKADEEMVLPDGAWKEYLAQEGQRILQNRRPLTLWRRMMNQESWYALSPMDCRGILFSYFVRQKMRFIHNSEGYAARDNFYIISPKKEPWLFFALLNNYYTYCQLEKLGRVYGAGLLKIQKYDIEQLFFPNPDALSSRTRSLLAKCGQCLAESGDASLVEEMTHILAEHFHADACDVICEYNQLKNKRLGKHHVH